MLHDPGSAQIALFVGWIPGALAALVGGIAVGFLTRSFAAIVIITLSGTVVGYVVCLSCVFGIGQLLVKRDVSPAVADRAYLAFLLSGAAAAIGVAFLGSVELQWAGMAGIAAVAVAVVVVAYTILTDSSGRRPLP